MRLSVVKRMFGDHIASRMVKMQNRELTFRVIAYNMHRMTDRLYSMVSTELIFPCIYSLK